MRRLILLVSIFLTSFAANTHGSTFLVGAGSHDITGPPAERVMMGYCDLKQTSAGISLRLRSRAFVIEEPDSKSRVALVVADLGMIFSAVKREVLKRLNAEFPGTYRDENVVISATHTHSGPGGYSNHTLFNISAAGFDKENFETIVDGIFQSIRKAHLNLKPEEIRLAEGQLTDTAVNRSRFAYRANHDWKDFENETDTSNILLRFGDLGMLNWFAVHATSMSKKNHFISSDNSGIAARLFERQYKQPFVAAFANANEGDASPNIFGSDSKLSDFVKTREIGRRRFEKAKELFENTTSSISSRLSYRHVWVTMPDYKVQSVGQSQQRLCFPAVGYSFVAGATDGPSEIPGYHEGMKQGPDFHPPYVFDSLAGLLISWIGGSRQGEDCHYPKPVFLSSSEKNSDMIPQTLPMQLVVLGELAIAAVPSEMTTMAGRRLKAVLAQELKAIGVTHIAISGLANEYSGYVATPEEYNEQSYPGAFTLYGPNTLEAYLEIFSNLAKAIVGNQTLAMDRAPPLRKAALIDPHLPIVFDGRKIGESFGKVLVQPNKNYFRDQSQKRTVVASFRGGHPNLFKKSDYFEIQRQTQDGWIPFVRDSDADPNTLFTWKRDRSFGCVACSTLSVHWRIPRDVPSGTYRVLQRGLWKEPLTGKLHNYEGVTDTFHIN